MPLILVWLVVFSGCGDNVAVRATAQAASESRKSQRRIVNGFDVTSASIPQGAIERGGPPKDGIPSIDNPKFVAINEAKFLKPDDLVVGVSFGGEARAYPLRVLVWHEIVNDSIGTNRIAVTYCPLCGTCMVFDRMIGVRVLDFGVSGLLYRSDVLMYDRQTESLWSQLKMSAVSGVHRDAKLKLLVSGHLTFDAWRKKHPKGRVLSTDTGFRRNYAVMPYRGYEKREGIMFPVGKIRNDLKNKDWVIGVIVDGVAHAVPIQSLVEKKEVKLAVGTTEVRVRFDPASRSAEVREVGTGAAWPYVKAYWFAWHAFYPETRLRVP